ncbi:hypothetical protein DYU11_28865 [Fibrisoma montanum]|uniref:LVIVD repeat-containing protein n=1 Tax=Fibrisoma montanum TaxID=2305895 RepID=A0A418LYG2_9BACT|nr:hypothetical protein [Fibrisoma montanum]RIV18254.1 hypothetical protein DYU11_28865 [Fibrisoma montanum]
MKSNVLLVLLLLPLVCLTACNDTCRETRTFRQFTPVTFTAEQIRNGVKQEAPRSLVNPGKIYTKDGYLLINEVKEGIHLIDNRDPANPRPVAFIRIPGNGDMAIRNNILYADSYMDLVALDISKLTDIKEVNRVQNVFPNGQFEGGWWSFNANTLMLSDQRVNYVTETVETNCEDGMIARQNACPNCMSTDFANRFVSAAPAPNTNGVGGSMARFTLYDTYLYTVGQQDMQLFNIQVPAEPRRGERINLGGGIETIFPYKDKLFIGSTTGMLIYDNTNPAKPVRMSVFQHARVCDPVVVHDNIAYVTLRSGTNCGGNLNQLDVVDIKDLYNPKLLKSYPMQNPHGLGVDFPNLFICEGQSGLKSLDARNALDVKQLEHLAGMNAYDVIPMGAAAGRKQLLMIGKDGLYQYDYTNPQQLQLLSKIAVNRPF